jgi:hypothetical protein
MNDNVFDHIVGRGVLKWDAVWRVVRWLADPSGGHGLGAVFRDRFTEYCFGQPASAVEVKIEFKLGKREGKERWVDMFVAAPDVMKPTTIALIDDISLRSPNDTRKMRNLRTYAELAKERYGEAALSLIAVTDGRDPGKFGTLQEELGQLEGVLFKLLPLHTIGGWIELPQARPEPVVAAFAEWAKAL